MFGLIPLKEFAKELKRPLNTVKTWKRRGALPEELFVQIGCGTFVKIDKFQEWINNKK